MPSCFREVVDVVEEVARVADYADRLGKYMGAFMAAVNFFVWGMAITGYWLVVTFIGPRGFEWTWAAVVMMVVAAFMVYLLLRITPKPARREVLPHEGFRWVLSFALPFMVIYLLPMPSAFDATLDWFLALGIAMLAVHLTVEREYVKRGFQVERPFLVCGVSMVASSPVLAYATLIKGFEAWPLSLGLLLLIYCGTGVYCVNKAWKLFF